MQISGPINGFELASVLGLLASQRQTGLLMMEADEQRAQIALREGRITGAVHSRQGKVLQLQQYVYRLGLIDNVKRDVLSRMREDDGLSFDDVLVKSGVITGCDLADIVTFKIREIIAEMLTWETVQYRFMQDVSLYVTSAVAVNLEVDQATGEACRQYDEWKKIAASFSWRNVTLRPTAQTHDQALERDQAVIYRLVRTATPLLALAEESGLGLFRTYRAVQQLVAAGLLAID